MRDPEEVRECCATTVDCHYLNDCPERPATEFLGKFPRTGGTPSTPESGDTRCGTAHPQHPSAKCRRKAGHRAKNHASLLYVWPST